MTRRAFVLGLGQIGRAVCANLLSRDWEVSVGSTSRIAEFQEGTATVPSFVLDRRDNATLQKAVADGFDLIVDTIAFDADDAMQWGQLRDRIGKLVVISSISVYADEQGRTLDEAWTSGAPKFVVPVPEDNRRVSPGPQTYSTRKVAMEDAVMALDLPSAIIRPGAIYGKGSRSPREWWIIQQVLAGRETIPVSWNGASRFHPVATENLAEIVRLSAEAVGSQILNAGDPACPTVLEIAQAVLDALGKTVHLVPFDGAPIGFKGLSPWSIEFPMIADLGAAQELGYEPIVTYGEAMPEVCKDIIARAARVGWKQAFPGLSVYPPGFFLE
ncbi:MAG: NAD-binding protein [Proteobacteria bacterium]|nr:NAD-binding protein [Pseudomonadota bacterium]